MRNLKAWDLSAKRMNEIRGYVDNDQTTKIFYAGMGGFVSYPKDKIIILEGTDVPDKNDKEIFVGSILKYKDGSIGEVYYSTNGGMVGYIIDFNRSIKGRYFDIAEVYTERSAFEIIGTVQENPELI